MSQKILLVEDELRNRQLVEEALHPEGYVVKSVGTVRDAKSSLARETFDLILLDVNLPDGDGFALCRDIRRQQNTPIIMMTARGDTSDIVAGLELGADDYIVKPFHVKTAVARIRAQLRRANELSASAPGEQAITVGEIIIDPATRDARINGTPAHLTQKEFQLLWFLAARRGRAVKKDSILHEVWGEEEERSDKLLAVYVRHLREKIEEQPENPRYLHTLRGFGYRLADEPETP
jgi:DNA-binding response OmpR family regulator